VINLLISDRPQAKSQRAVGGISGGCVRIPNRVLLIALILVWFVSQRERPQEMYAMGGNERRRTYEISVVKTTTSLCAQRRVRRRRGACVDMCGEFKPHQRRRQDAAIMRRRSSARAHLRRWGNHALRHFWALLHGAGQQHHQLHVHKIHPLFDNGFSVSTIIRLTAQSSLCWALFWPHLERQAKKITNRIKRIQDKEGVKRNNASPKDWFPRYQ
jgi:hypothetical protein